MLGSSVKILSEINLCSLWIAWLLLCIENVLLILCLWGYIYEYHIFF